jgi:hypothetical protein
MNINEQRRLVPVKVYYLNDAFLMQDDAGKELTVKACPESFRDFLKKLNAYDCVSEPRTSRSGTYMDIVDGIMGRVDNIIFIWSTYWDLIETNYLILS